MPSRYLVPVSVKGIVFENNGVWLRKNERKEWELPGGKLDEGEQPEETVERELREELGFQTRVRSLVHAHLYTIPTSTDESSGVLVVSFLCEIKAKTGEFEFDGEAGRAEFSCFPVADLAGLPMPDFYLNAISLAREMSKRALAHHESGGQEAEQ